MTAWSASGCVTVDMNQRTVQRFAPGDALINGTAPLELAAQPGADLESLKKDVFGRFIANSNIPVASEGSDALTKELAEFVRCVETGEKPLVSGSEAYDAMVVADSILGRVSGHQWDGRPHGAVGPYPHKLPWLRKAG
jgi:predicted dehydrogenase